MAGDVRCILMLAAMAIAGITVAVAPSLSLDRPPSEARTFDDGRTVTAQAGPSVQGDDMEESNPALRSSKGTFIATLIALVVMLGGMALAFGPAVIRYFEQRRVLEHGQEATAIIVEVVDTGNRVNMNPEVKLQLRIDDGAGGTFGSQATTYLSPVDLPRYQVGEKVRVRYDPENPSAAFLVTGAQ